MAPDPIQQTAKRISGNANPALERRLKENMFQAIIKVKPDLATGVDFDTDVMSGTFFELSLIHI